jgi:hypothetical protein
MGNKISRKEREYLKKYKADTLTLTLKDWQVIRSMFRIMFRQSKTAINTKEFNKAINNISRSTDKEIFIRYYIQKQSLTRISIDCSMMDLLYVYTLDEWLDTLLVCTVVALQDCLDRRLYIFKTYNLGNDTSVLKKYFF